MVEPDQSVPDVVAEVVRKKPNPALPAPLADVHEFVAQKVWLLSTYHFVKPVPGDQDGVAKRHGGDAGPKYARHPHWHRTNGDIGDVQVPDVKA